MSSQILGSLENPWDVIISGAGPAGLAAAIFCARAGFQVVVCEKADRCAPFPRGETVHNHPIFDELLGNGYLESIALHHTAARKFNSPESRKSFEIFRPTPSIVFKWEQFIDRLYAQATALNIIFKFQTEIVSPIIIDQICVGIQTKSEEMIYAKTVLACEGNNSPLGISAGVSYSKMNCQIVKSIISNFSNEYRGFEYFFIPSGQLLYAPRFPPSIVFIFPRDGQNCEIGMMTFTKAALGMKKYCDMPSDSEVLRVWQQLKLTYPRLSTILHGSKVELEQVTQIPTAEMYWPAMPIPGLALLGDSMGFIETSGASGIVSSLLSTQFCAGFLTSHKNDSWDSQLQEHYNIGFQNTPIYHHIAKLYKIIPTGIGLIFKYLRTPARINRWWWLIHLFYKLG